MDRLIFKKGNKRYKYVYITDIKTEQDIDYLHNYCVDNHIFIDSTAKREKIINYIEKQQDCPIVICSFAFDRQLLKTVKHCSYNPEEYKDQKMTLKEFMWAYNLFKKEIYDEE